MPRARADTRSGVLLLGILIICVATVPLAGGRLGRMADLQFDRSWAVIAAIVLQVLIISVFPDGNHGLHAALHLVSYGLLFYVLAANLDVPGLWLIGLGGACNALAIAANDGVMPALPSALDTAGILQVPGEFANSAAVAQPKLFFLGDIFAIPHGLPFSNVFSVGDILLAIGAFVVLHRQCHSRIAAPMLRLAAWVDRTGPRMDLLRRHRAFRRLWVANTISAIGDFVYPLAVFTAVVDDDTKTSSLAFLLIAQVGPGMVVGLLGGPFIDRFSRKWLMVATDLARGAAVMSLLFVGDPSLTHLYAVSCVLGVGSALFTPAFMASLPNLVPSRHLAAANAFVGVTLALAVTIGPALGAVIVNQFGISWGFTANALSFFFSAALVAGTVVPGGVRALGESHFVRELVEGLRYIRRHREVLAVVVVVGVVTLAAGIKSPLEPLFALRALDGGASGLAALGAAWGLGMVVGGAFASQVDGRFGHARVITWSVALVALTVAVAAGSPTLTPVLLLWLIAGVANVVGTVAYETLLQEQTPDHVRGRVLAAVETSAQAGVLLGVGMSALTDSVFTHNPSRWGMLVSGIVFGLAAVISFQMLQRRRRSRAAVPAVPRLELSRFELLPAGPSLALVRVTALGLADAEAPVLLVDDGARLHRVEPLPAGAAGGSFGYSVPRALLALRRTALALEVRGRGLLDLPPPSPLAEA